MGHNTDDFVMHFEPRIRAKARQLL